MPKRSSEETGRGSDVPAAKMPKDENVRATRSRIRVAAARETDATVLESSSKTKSVPYGELRLVHENNRSDGAAQPEVIELPNPSDSAPLIIGRHVVGGKSISITCPSALNFVSSRHAEMTINADGVHLLKDLDTTNGTYVNGALISTPEKGFSLKNGDVVSFGGPGQVVIDKKIMKNPFRFVYYRLPSVEVWSSVTRGHVRPPALPDWMHSEVKCAICMEFMANPHSLDGCGHVFCRACLLRSIATKKQCPTCRKRLPPFRRVLVSPNHLIREMVNRVESEFTSLEEVRNRAEHKSILDTRLARAESNSHLGQSRDHHFGLNLANGSTNFPVVFLIDRSTMENDRLIITRPDDLTPPTNAAASNATNATTHDDRPAQRGDTDTGVSWRGLVNTQTPTCCVQCGLVIPERCFRLVRRSVTTNATTETMHFHAYVGCVQRYARELKTPGVLTMENPENTEQEKRVVTGIIECLTDYPATA